MDIQKAIELIEKSEHIGIILAKEASLDSVASSEVLAKILQERGKKIGLLAGPPKEAFPRRDLFLMLHSSARLPKEFVVTVNTSLSPVSQLRYEKSEGRIDIVLSPKSSPMTKESLSFRDGKVLCDCAITIGVADIDSLADLSEVGPEFFTEVPVINIDVSDHNKQFGEVDLVDSAKGSISEIVYELFTALKGGPPENESPTLLLAGILSATNGFRSPTTTADSLLAASEFVRLGAKSKEAFLLLGESRSLGSLQLFGRAAVRSKVDAGQGVLWSFITAEDFEKTGTSRHDITRVLAELDTAFPPHRVAAALWQDPQEKTVRATLSGERSVLKEVQARGGGEFKSPHLELSISYASFREAEDAISALLAGL